MWIVTDKGFFSFVVDRKDSNYLWLRARVREDLVRNFPDAEIIEKPGADYLFRAKVLRTEVAAQMSQMIMEADITGHFKDVAKQRSAKPTHGDRGTAYYAFWTAMAALQPYAPYSKTPRPAPKPWTPPARGGALFQHGGSWTQPTGGFTRSTSGGSQRASDFDWDARSWGGVSSPDPARFSEPTGEPWVDPEVLDEVTQELLGAASDEEFEEIWETLTDEEREAYLDAQEQAQRAREEIEEEFGAAARMLELHQGPDGWVTTSPDSHPAPRLTRRERRAEARAQRNREGLNGQESQNRQAYQDKKAKLRGKKRHNQQG